MWLLLLDLAEYLEVKWRRSYVSGEDLSRYLNKIESVGLRKCP